MIVQELDVIESPSVEKSPVAVDLVTESPEPVKPVESAYLETSHAPLPWIDEVAQMSPSDRLMNAPRFSQAEAQEMEDRASSVGEKNTSEAIPRMSAEQLVSDLNGFTESHVATNPNLDAATGGIQSREFAQNYANDVLEAFAEDKYDKLLRESNGVLTPELLRSQLGIPITPEQATDSAFLIQEIKKSIPASELIEHFARIKVLKKIRDASNAEALRSQSANPENNPDQPLPFDSVSESAVPPESIPASETQPQQELGSIDDEVASLDVSKVNKEQARRIAEIYKILNGGAESAVDFARVDQLINLVFDVKGGGTWAKSRGSVETSAESKREESTLKALRNVLEDDESGKSFMQEWLSSMNVDLEKDWAKAVHSRIADAHDDTALNHADRKAEFIKNFGQHLKKNSEKNSDLDVSTLVFSEAIENYLIEKAQKLQQKQSSK